jgi:hypothetical protein
MMITRPRSEAANEILRESSKTFGEAAVARVQAALFEGVNGPRDPRGLIRRGRQAVKTAFIPGLDAQPWHDAQQHPGISSSLHHLQSNFTAFKHRILNAASTSELGFYDHGDLSREQNQKWRTLFFSKNGVTNPDTMSAFPEVARFVDALAGHLCPFGDVFLSILEPGLHIPPHHDLVNFTLTLHFAISVPLGCTLRVDTETREWKENSACLFDQSFEHEARNPSNQPRICLLANLWHPGLSVTERQVITRLAPLFV